MARRDRDLASSLFPFLSVLACVIGTLTLLIAALATSQMAEGLRALDPDEPAPPELATQRARVRALQRRLEAARDAEAERTAVQAELRALGIEPSGSTGSALQHVSARLSSARLARRLETLRREARQLERAVVGISNELEQPRERDDRRTLRIHPLGRGTALRPFYVECRVEGVRIFHEGLDDSVFLDRKVPRDRSSFEKFLRRAQAIDNHTVVFLIRPDGVETYDWAVRTSHHLSVRHAKLPLPGFGDIEFAL